MDLFLRELSQVTIDVVEESGRRLLAAAPNATPSLPPRWIATIWDKNIVEPAMLRVPLVTFLFILLWALNVMVMDRAKLPYFYVLSVRSVQPSTAFFTALTCLFAYVSIVTLGNMSHLELERGLVVFYFLLMLLCAAPFVPGRESRGHFLTLLKRVLLPVPNPEYLAALSGAAGGRDRDRDRDGGAGGGAGEDDAENSVHKAANGGIGGSTAMEKGKGLGGSSSNLSGAVTAGGVDNAGSATKLGASPLHGNTGTPASSAPSTTTSSPQQVSPLLSPVPFCEVLLADALCSLSKVFKDAGTTIIALMAFVYNEPLTAYHTSGMLLLAVLASIPFMLRVRQCSIQLYYTVDSTARSLVCINIFKYLSSFPSIWITALISVGWLTNSPSAGSLAVLLAVVNSTVSYGWDIFMDWGLLGITASTWRVTCRTRLFYSPVFYLVAAACNLVLRFTWAVNRVPYFAQMHPAQLVLLMEIAEIVRRSVWNVIRIEWEVIQQEEKAMKCRDMELPKQRHGGTVMISPSSQGRPGHYFGDKGAGSKGYNDFSSLLGLVDLRDRSGSSSYNQ